MKQTLVLFLITANILCYNQTAQTQSEAGRPFMSTYNPIELGGDLQTWAFVQDKRGVMYAGNQPGVLEFDGASWRMITTANNSFVRSLDIDEKGTIYVGAQADFGYLTPDNKGELQFVSLLSKVENKNARSFGYIWTTHSTPEGIYFQANEYIFRFKPITNDLGENETSEWEVKIWEPKDKFNYAFWIDETYYVQQSGPGLTQMKSDVLIQIPGGGQFGGERLQVFLPYGKGLQKEEGKYLVGTFNRGLFLYDAKNQFNRFTPFKTKADNFLKSNTLYDGAVLSDGTYGLSTINAGFVAIDHQGNDLVYLDQQTGLSSNSILSNYVDKDGHLWLGPESGISIVEIPSPLTLYDNSTGVNGAVYDIIRHNGTLYISTSIGVSYLDANEGIFKMVSGFVPGNHQTFKFMSRHNDLLMAVGTGLHKLETKTTARVIKKSTALSFLVQDIHQSLRNPNRIFLGLFDGLATLRFSQNSNKWIYEGRIAGIDEYVSSVTEVEPGLLWLGTNARGIMRLKLKNNSTEVAKLERFGVDHGIPDGGASVMRAFDNAYFITSDGLKYFDEDKNTFVTDTTFNIVEFSNAAINYNGLSEDEHGNVWINFGRETAVMLKQPDGTFKPEKMAFQRFADKPATKIYPEENGVVWFGTNDGLIRYDPSIQKNYNVSYQALIRRVTSNEDSVVYAGAEIQPCEDLEPSQESCKQVSLPYANNALRFEFSAPNYDNPRENQYQSILEGFNKRWSHWSKENFRTYTNLPHGDYKFKVRAKNIFQHISAEAAYEFSIEPPWYRTWWAYGLYLLILGFIVYGGDRVQRRRLVKRERERSKLREAELRAKTAEAEANALHSENERKKNIELLSEIGKEITASLDMDTIFFKLYEHVNQLADATIFGVGLYHPEKEEIEYRLAIEKGRKYEPYTRDTKDKNQFPVWCIENKKPVFINNAEKEFTNYLKEYKTDSDAGRKLEDGEVSGIPISIIYLPLITKDKVIGVITIQSYEKNAYTKHHLNLLQNLATYTTIAFDNAEAYTKLNATLENLQATQEKLVTQEKLASLGALTAGIAHEIKNPLNFVNNFAELSQELVDELREDLEKNAEKVDKDDVENIRAILSDLEQNAKKINEHGKRADSIVKSMLQHSRGKKGERQATDINAMLEEDINLAYHGLRAQDSGFNSTIEKDFAANLDKIEVVPQEISRVFLNIITNGFYAAHQRSLQNGEDFSPKLSVHTKIVDSKIEVRIRDNGKGIPENIREKIFQPFFTTKPTGQGTGLGLSISYDIVVQEHNGEIRVDSKESEFTEFIITLPR